MQIHTVLFTCFLTWYSRSQSHWSFPPPMPNLIMPTKSFDYANKGKYHQKAHNWWPHKMVWIRSDQITQLWVTYPHPQNCPNQLRIQSLSIDHKFVSIGSMQWGLFATHNNRSRNAGIGGLRIRKLCFLVYQEMVQLQLIMALDWISTGTL